MLMNTQLRRALAERRVRRRCLHDVDATAGPGAAAVAVDAIVALPAQTAHMPVLQQLAGPLCVEDPVHVSNAGHSPFFVKQVKATKHLSTHIIVVIQHTQARSHHGDSQRRFRSLRGPG